jgi:hypothetical protein
MRGRIFTVLCLFACALFSGTAGALDGTGSGTLQEKITIRGCETGLESRAVTDFSIGTLGAWSLSTTEAGWAGDYTLKLFKKKKRKKQGYVFNLVFDDPSYNALIEQVGEASNQLCDLAPDTLAITESRVNKFIARLSLDRTTVTLKLELAAKASDGAVTYSPKYSLLAEIAFTPTGGGIGGKISGKVLAPDGQIAAREPPGLLVSLGDFLLPSSSAAVSGLSKVPNGTPVELVHLSVAGTVDGVLATTKVYKGKYRFHLDRLGHFDAPDIAVRVSDRGVQLRAFLTSTTVDITPLSEAVFQLALETLLATPGALLGNYTFAELDDLFASVDLLTSLEALPAVPGVDATVAAIKDLVAQDTGITAFLMAAAEAGQTDTGPGDIGNLSPLSVGNTWVYVVDISGYGQRFTSQVEITGTMEIDGITTMVANYSSSPGQLGPYDEYVEKNSRGIYNWGNSDPEDPLTPLLVPYQEAAFPLKPGVTLESINVTGMVWPEDLDSDGVNERFDLSMSITTLGFEAVSVPAGDFPNSVKEEVLLKVDVTLSRSGKHVKVTERLTDWYASGIGMVRSDMKITARAFGRTSTDTSTALLDGYRVDGQTGGNVPPARLHEKLE